MKEYVIGYLFLLAGVAIMSFSAWQAYLLFTGKMPAYDVFKAPVATEQPKLTSQTLLADPSTATKLQTEMFSQIIQKEMGKSLNFGATLFFMYFLMTLGYRFSLIGVQLVRPIKVALRAKNVEIDPKNNSKPIERES